MVRLLRIAVVNGKREERDVGVFPTEVDAETRVVTLRAGYQNDKLPRPWPTFRIVPA
jgi:hypothetical protein